MAPFLENWLLSTGNILVALIGTGYPEHVPGSHQYLKVNTTVEL
jgi:hypothetical protein